MSVSDRLFDSGSGSAAGTAGRSRGDCLFIAFIRRSEESDPAVFSLKAKSFSYFSSAATLRIRAKGLSNKFRWPLKIFFSAQIHKMDSFNNK